MNKCLNCGQETNNKKFCSISCQNKIQNKEKVNKRLGLFVNFTVKCSNCGKKFVVTEREKLFPQKEKYYCSRGCANTRTPSEKTKQLISSGIVKSLKTNKKEGKKVKLYCKSCGKEFEVNYNKRKQLFCSRSCAKRWELINTNAAHAMGIKSVQSQSKARRSKNEIYFAELCKNHFNKVLTNEPMFNGWDADVIIEDIKTAVLWNGKWHYEKIKDKHSVAQVQNREKIKIKEIEDKGYKIYIIKDMGKHEKEFVENEFNKFLLSL